MNEKVLRFCREQNLLPAGSSVTCAVSGGADSMAMLQCLCALRAELSITIAAAHFNHGLRGKESDGDEAFVRAFCEAHGIPLTVGRGDAAAYAKEHSLSIETAARELRYAFLGGLSGLIATAHNADDNAETVLMNLLRGTGLHGLCGIPFRRDSIVRPMLCVTREEILAYLEAAGTPWREDSSNAEDDCRRNRIRHGVMPLLKAENPAFSETVFSESLRLRSENDHLEAEAAAVLSAAKREKGYDCTVLSAQPEALQRRAILKLLREQHAADAHHVETVRSLVCSPGSVGQTVLPGGLTAVKSYGLLQLRRETPPPLGEYSLPVPGVLTIPEMGLAFHSFFVENFEKKPNKSDTIFLNYDMIDNGITVRSRKTGDTISLAAGSRSLKRLMIDRKIPQADRDRIPVLSAGGTVLAVRGLGVSRPYLPAPGHRVLAVQIKNI